MSLNIDNLKPYEEDDNRKEERSRGGKISGYKRLKRKQEKQAQRFFNMSLEALDGSAEQRQDKLKSYMHARRIESNRYKKLSDKVSRRRNDLIKDGVKNDALR